MLKKLTIQNYALIDHLELDFHDGLNIITGETGAGKSILLGALSLILGQRADSSLLLDSNKKSIVEGEFGFSKNKKSVIDFFSEQELDLEKSIFLRREITHEGKSRAFINDTPVNLQQLRELSGMLVDIHSQHETLLLNKSDFQLSTIDAFAEVGELVSNYKSDYKTYLEKQNSLKDLIELEKKAKSDQDYFQFQFTELDEANLESDEQGKLEEELQTFSHVEEIGRGLATVEQLISGADGNSIQKIHDATIQIQNLVNYNSRLSLISDRLKSTEIELQDIASEIESVTDDLIFDPARLEIINERLNIINRLLQKHRVNSIENLIQLKGEFHAQLSSIDSLELQIKQSEKECNKLKTSLVDQAEKISAKRGGAIPNLENGMKKLLKEVGMPNAILKIENTLLSKNEIGPNGIDTIKFLFSANKGIAYSDISKVASGGELSRLMLCIKSSIAKLIDLPSLIFDEIDTGVSGETAFKIGNLMQAMSAKHQLITITHLPQIAGKGGHHFYVYKEVISNKTYTKVKSLSVDERVVEVARMLSGDKPTPIAIANAKELMKI